MSWALFVQCYHGYFYWDRRFCFDFRSCSWLHSLVKRGALRGIDLISHYSCSFAHCCELQYSEFVVECISSPLPLFALHSYSQVEIQRGNSEADFRPNEIARDTVVMADSWKGWFAECRAGFIWPAFCWWCILLRAAQLERALVPICAS